MWRPVLRLTWDHELISHALAASYFKREGWTNVRELERKAEIHSGLHLVGDDPDLRPRASVVRPRLSSAGLGDRGVRDESGRTVGLGVMPFTPGTRKSLDPEHRIPKAKFGGSVCRHPVGGAEMLDEVASAHVLGVSAEDGFTLRREETEAAKARPTMSAAALAFRPGGVWLT